MTDPMTDRQQVIELVADFRERFATLREADDFDGMDDAVDSLVSALSALQPEPKQDDGSIRAEIERLQALAPTLRASVPPPPASDEQKE